MKARTKKTPAKPKRAPKKAKKRAKKVQPLLDQIGDAHEALRKLAKRRESAWHRWETGKHTGSRSDAEKRSIALDVKLDEAERKVLALEAEQTRQKKPLLRIGRGRQTEMFGQLELFG